MSACNRDYIARNEHLEPVMRICITSMCEGDEKVRTAISLMESLFKHSPETRFVVCEIVLITFERNYTDS
jgi:hypothetical protein